MISSSVLEKYKKITNDIVKDIRNLFRLERKIKKKKINISPQLNTPVIFLD